VRAVDAHVHLPVRRGPCGGAGHPDVIYPLGRVVSRLRALVRDYGIGPACEVVGVLEVEALSVDPGGERRVRGRVGLGVEVADEDDGMLGAPRFGALNGKDGAVRLVWLVVVEVGVLEVEDAPVGDLSRSVCVCV